MTVKKTHLTDEDYCVAAKRLRCEVAAIKAVAVTESRGSGFLSSGKPKILFERHKFYKYTKGKFARSHPHICNRTAGGYGRGGENQWIKFSEAFKLDPIAAMLSCSWGEFQIMGFNYALVGFSNIHDFVDAMKEGADKHLDAFVEYVIHTRLDDEIRNHQWARFAAGYNGKGYRKNKYDTKMASAYARFSKKKIDCSKILRQMKDEIEDMTATTPRDETPDADTIGDETDDAFVDEGGNETDDAVFDETTDESEAENNADESETGQLTVLDQEPIGDDPEVVGKETLGIEDLKPFCIRWGKRIWGTFAGINGVSLSALVPTAISTGNWKTALIYLAIAAVIFIITALFVVAGSVFIWKLWSKNRTEIKEYLKQWVETKHNPMMKNYEIDFNKVV